MFTFEVAYINQHHHDFKASKSHQQSLPNAR